MAVEEEPHIAFDQSEEGDLVLQLVGQLCKDAGMRNKRVASRGEEYTIAENAVAEYVGWCNMPWERY